MSTYTLSAARAGAGVVRQAVAVARVAEEDGGLDGGEGRAGQRGAGAAAEGVVHDLAALAVADEDNLGVGALAVEVGHGLDDGCGSLGGLLK